MSTLTIEQRINQLEVMLTELKRDAAKPALMFKAGDEVWVKGKIAAVDIGAQEEPPLPYRIEIDGDQYWLSADCIVPKE